MKCDVCGKEIDEEESYKGCCKECASKIFSDIQPKNRVTKIIKELSEEDTNKNSENTKTNKESHMIWWNIWKYFLFPLRILTIILVSISLLNHINLNMLLEYIVLLFSSTSIIYVLYIFLTFYVFYCFIKRNNENGYKLFIFYLIFEIILNCIIYTFSNNILFSTSNYHITIALNLIISLTIYGLFWLLPNLIYFKKRKKYFSNYTITKNKIK